MKYIVPILLFISLSVHGQSRLNGFFYGNLDSIEYNMNFSLIFSNDSNFEFSTWSCVWSKHGKGIYKVKDDTLKLFFVGNEMPKNDNPKWKYPSSHYPVKNGTIWSYQILKQNEDTLTLKDSTYTITYLKREKTDTSIEPISTPIRITLPTSTSSTATKLNDSSCLIIKIEKTDYKISLLKDSVETNDIKKIDAFISANKDKITQNKVIINGDANETYSRVDKIFNVLKKYKIYRFQLLTTPVGKATNDMYTR
jgi:biopolymer transport protein ExbD